MAVSMDKAGEFMLLNGRLIERTRFAFLFKNGTREQVVAALQAYQNLDGGFGNALEPDLRAPLSQPEPVDLAIGILDEAGAMHHPMLRIALDYLQSVTRPDGGVPFMLPSATKFPHAPWWEPEDDLSGSLIPTATIVGNLLKNGIEHPWLGAASDFCWNKIENSQSITPYQARAIMPFLDNSPDRPRAERAWSRASSSILDGENVALDPYAEGEVHFPLDYAPAPDTMARRLFSDELISEHLDALETKQLDDGGWAFNWPIWTPIVEPEWRGYVTVGTLKTLQAYGRL